MKTNQPTQGIKLRLHPKFFENESGRKVGECPPQERHEFVFQKVVMPPGGGVAIQFQGCLYPRYGFPFEEATYACDIVKRNLMNLVMTLSSRKLWLSHLGFLVLPWKSKISVIDEALERFAGHANSILSPVYLKEEYLCPCSLELRRFIARFLYGIGIRRDVAELFAKVFSTLTDNDDAYRYRIQDIFSELPRAMVLEHPFFSVYSAWFTIKQRDKQVSKKFKPFALLFLGSLFFRRVRRALREAVIMADYDKLGLSPADEYHTLLRVGYDYRGRSQELRLKWWEDIHEGKLPPQIHITA